MPRSNARMTTGRERTTPVPGQSKQLPTKLFLNHPGVVDEFSSVT